MSDESVKRRIVVRRTTPQTIPSPEPEATISEPVVVSETDVADDWVNADLPIKETKQAISLRIDRDIIEFFKESGKGYQTRMNAVLRAYMEAKRR